MAQDAAHFNTQFYKIWPLPHYIYIKNLQTGHNMKPVKENEWIFMDDDVGSWKCLIEKYR